MKWVTLIATHARMRGVSLSAAPRRFQGLTCTSKTLNVGLLHTFLIKDPNWIFMFAENAFTKSVGSRAKQEEKDLCFSLSLEVRNRGAGVSQTKSWQPWPLGPLEPAYVLLKAFLFFLWSHGHQSQSWSVQEGSWVRLWEKKKGEEQILWHRCQEKSPNASSGRKATFPGSWACWNLLETRALAGRTKVDSGTRIQRGSSRGGPQGRRGGGFSESYKLKTERMSGHLHFLPLLMGIISLAPSFLETNFK